METWVQVHDWDTPPGLANWDLSKAADSSLIVTALLPNW